MWYTISLRGADAVNRPVKFIALALLMAMLLLGTAELGYYLIVLAVTGTVSGVFVGLCGALAVKRIPVGNI